MEHSAEMMKSGTSLLNPYATPFIPFSRQRADNENVAPITSENSKIDHETVQCKQVKEDEVKAAGRTWGDSNSSYGNPQHQLPTNSYIEGPSNYGELYSLEDSMSHKRKDGTERRSSFADHELDLAYLTAEFPGLSEQSLVDVYCANAGDLEASVDMLIQLEVLIHQLCKTIWSFTFWSFSQSLLGCS